MPRFVILHHQTPPHYDRATHWDLMLEKKDKLLTWALHREPVIGQTTDAEQLADHRLEYLDYEGSVSGERGTVTRWDTGDYQIHSESDGETCAVLCGQRLACTIMLRQIDGQRWTVSFSDD